MKRAINIRLEEKIILTLEQLSDELHTTKTDIVEKAIQLFSKQKKQEANTLLQYAGILDNRTADSILKVIEKDKNSKEFTMDIE